MKAKSLLPVAFVWSALVLSFRSGLAQTWTLTSAPSTNWTSVACSADGSNLVASVSGGSLYTSTDSAATWTPTRAPIAAWQSVAISADGRKMVAVIDPGFIYTSSDSGVTWTQSPAPAADWSSIASSGDGNRLVAVTYDRTSSPPAVSGQVYTSTNSGTSWQFVPGSWAGPYSSVAASADGTTFAAVGFYAGPGVFAPSDCLSTNWGAEITHIYPQVAEPWTAVACSANGMQMVAGAFNDRICFSTDAGVTWTPATSPILFCSSIASSAAGNKMVAVEGPNFSFPALKGAVYISTNCGSAWFSTTAPVTNWSSVACSADGCRLVAAISGGGIYVSQTMPTPIMNISATGSGVVISWTVPSQPFLLQEKTDLATPNWADVASSPVLNLTNLQTWVTLPAPASDRFYRLKSTVNGN